ncbi:MAG: hypothetical protein RI922_1481 [Bacteroidota bacterium]
MRQLLEGIKQKKMEVRPSVLVTEDLEVQVKMSKPTRFKAGGELSGKVNRVGVQVNEDLIENKELFELKMVISREATNNSTI